MFWDKISNTMTVPANATNSQDIGDYPITIELSDGVKTGYTSNSPDTWIGNATYTFRLTIYSKQPMSVRYEKPPDVRLE